MDHYQRLGVSSTATLPEIKAAYRQKARELHPDQHPGDAAKEDAFKELAEAYRVLSNQERRREYDAGRFRLPSEDSRVFAVKAGQDVFDFVAGQAQKAAGSKLRNRGELGKKAAKAADSIIDFGRSWGHQWLEEKIRRRP